MPIETEENENIKKDLNNTRKVKSFTPLSLKTWHFDANESSPNPKPVILMTDKYDAKVIDNYNDLLPPINISDDSGCLVSSLDISSISNYDARSIHFNPDSSEDLINVTMPSCPDLELDSVSSDSSETEQNLISLNSLKRTIDFADFRMFQSTFKINDTNPNVELFSSTGSTAENHQKPKIINAAFIQVPSRIPLPINSKRPIKYYRLWPPTVDQITPPLKRLVQPNFDISPTLVNSSGNVTHPRPSAEDPSNSNQAQEETGSASISPNPN